MGLIAMVISMIFCFIIVGAGQICGGLSENYPNTVSGYKTKSAIRNKDTWKEANEYFSKKLLQLGNLYIVVILITGFHYLDNYSIVLLINSLMAIVIILLSIVITEIHIKKLFDENGNKKT